MTGFSISDFNSTCAEIFNTIREIKKSLARQDIQRGLVPWFDKFTGETTEEGLKNGISLDTVVPHGDTHTPMDHDVADIFADVACQHGSMDASPSDPICLESSELEPKDVEFGEKEIMAEIGAVMSSDVEETSDFILRSFGIRFDLKSDNIVTTIARVLPRKQPVVSIHFSNHCSFFLNRNMSIVGKKGENCSDFQICASKCFLSSCLQAACENVRKSLPVYLTTAWNLFTSERGFFCCKKVKFDYMKSGKPPPLPPDITKYFIIYKGIFTEVCDGINWRCARADFIIIWSFSIQFAHNDMKLWSLKVILGSDVKLMILVHYNKVEKCVRNFMGIVTAYFNGSRHKITKNEGMIVWLTVVIINELTTVVIVYGVNKKATSLGGGSVPLLNIEERILEVNDTANDIHIDREDYDSKMINHFYPEWGAYNIIENLKVQQHITNFDRTNKYIASTTQTTIGVDTVTDIHSVVIAVYTWPKNYGDPSKCKDLSTLIRGAATSISSDEKAVLREVAQSLFEGSIYTFELLQMILSPIDKEIPCLAKCMLAYGMGGSLVSRLTAHSATQVKCLVNIIILLFGDLGHGKPTTIKHIVILLELVKVPDMCHHSRFWVVLNFSSSVKAGVDLCEGSGYPEWISSIILGMQVWLNNENVKGLRVSYFQATHDIIGSASDKPPPNIMRLSSIHNCDLLIHICGRFSPLITKLGSEKMVSLSVMSVASSLTTSGSKVMDSTNLSSLDSIPSTVFYRRLSNAQYRMRSTKITTTSTGMSFNKDSLVVQRMQASVTKLTDLGGVTLDSKQWNVVIHSEDRSSTIVADDGLTTIQDALLETLSKNVGAKLAMHSAAETNNLAGNVTITFVILVEGLIIDGVNVAVVSASDYKVGNMIEEVTRMVERKGVLTLAFSMRCTKKFFMFSLLRPPETANLEDKVDFKGVGMIRAWKVK